MNKVFIEALGKKARYNYLNGKLSEVDALRMAKYYIAQVESYSVDEKNYEELKRELRYQTNHLIKGKIRKAMDKWKERKQSSRAQNSVSMQKLAMFEQKAIGDVCLRTVVN